MPSLKSVCLINVLMVRLFVGSANAADPKIGSGHISSRDQQAILAVIEAYRTAWLANDPKGVLRTFTEDGVLQPAHGAPAVVERRYGESGVGGAVRGIGRDDATNIRERDGDADV